MTEAESLERFGTVVFGSAMIRQLITFDPVRGSFELQRWIDFVPPGYRNLVGPLAVEAFEPFRGRPFDVECIEEYAAQLSNLLGGRLQRQPVPPTAIAWLRANPEGHMGSASVVKDAKIEQVGGRVRDLRRAMADRLATAMRAAGATNQGYSVPALQEIAAMYDSDLAVLVDAIVNLGRMSR